jgi:hypothetical protein
MFDLSHRARELHAHTCHLVLVQYEVGLQEILLEKRSREGVHCALAEEDESLPQNAAAGFS